MNSNAVKRTFKVNLRNCTRKADALARIGASLGCAAIKNLDALHDILTDLGGGSAIDVEADGDVPEPVMKVFRDSMAENPNLEVVFSHPAPSGVNGSFASVDGEEGIFYRISNYDRMGDFFMTVASSSDIWNFCWSHGGLTAGRVNCDHAVFPYYTADKVADAKSYTGPYTAVSVGDTLWEPFASLYASPAVRRAAERGVTRNLYKNAAGTEVWFEEVNQDLKLAFRQGWTSSAKYGLVRKAVIANLSGEEVSLKVLDGCRNILPACATAEFQNNMSVLLDAYKKTDLDAESNLAIFAVSSIVTDKAEPSEGLFANVCWFTDSAELKLAPDAPEQFAARGEVETVGVVKGGRPAAYICREVALGPGASASWRQVFDTHLDAARIAALKRELADRAALSAALEADIAEGKALMEAYIGAADGSQQTAATMTCVHHTANVMFNIMRGGIFADNGRIGLADFVRFVAQRNKALVSTAEQAVERMAPSVVSGGVADYSALEAAVRREGNPQLLRVFREYLPLTFSRRHGDPSRPWNRFSILLRDADGSPILNYEGNWRDIFQNWEALVWSYPQYIRNMTAKFLNAMTIDGFNPYRISREGIDWETQDPENPWAQIGYWGDHQVVYLQKLLEFDARLDRKALVAALGEKIFASSNVPYRIRPYADIVADPRHTIVFDSNLGNLLCDRAAREGSDAKLVRDGGPEGDGPVSLVSLAAKLLQIVIAKMANFVPGGGIWLNTQRPEWNDANNALAGYGLSMVTLCYLHRFVRFLRGLFASSDASAFALPPAVADCFADLARLYASTPADAASRDPALRKKFTDEEGRIFERERESLYAHGYGDGETALAKDRIVASLDAILAHITATIACNRRPDGLYHAYNTLGISRDGMEVGHLQEMLEGQVAVLSAGILKPDEALGVLKALRASRMYEPRQNSYMLYPDRELAAFEEKNRVAPADAAPLDALIAKTGGAILRRDCNGIFHFNGEFRNVRFLREFCASLPEGARPSQEELAALEALYEKTFVHRSFTGRSGTFYAYEGLGSIYWHMVSKLLLAAQENALAAVASGAPKETVAELTGAYYAIRAGIGFNKSPEVYGAFPADPYSHTPSGQGAKQPGMTGQVKEEILTRWGELGVDIVDGRARFAPTMLKDDEFFADGTLRFTWCGAPVVYRRGGGKPTIAVNGVVRDGNTLSAEESADLFARNGRIREIAVGLP